MKNLLLWTLLLTCLAGVCLTGCDGTAYTYEERMVRAKMINEYNFRQFVDDWDYFWLYDRNLRGSQWHPRIGM
ncbi:MAG: hypothetical protein ACLFUJ_13565 [Phycisphaerae bacterium]